MQNLMRINKYMSESGICSRRKADEWIEAGKVKVNGIVAKPGQKIDPEVDKVDVSGEKIELQEEKVYYILNKPQKVITTASDDRGRKTVVSLIPEKKRIFPIGRLDFETEGLIILTNDGELYNRIIHPKSEVFKSYFAQIEGRASNDEIDALRKGVVLDDGKTLPAKVKILKESGANTEIEISIREGRNRQIRRMCDKIGHKVIFLKRVSIGKLTLGNLKPGEYRKLTESEVEYLYSL